MTRTVLEAICLGLLGRTAVQHTVFFFAGSCTAHCCETAFDYDAPTVALVIEKIFRCAIVKRK
jgi:hypothetical protein